MRLQFLTYFCVCSALLTPPRVYLLSGEHSGEMPGRAVPIAFGGDGFDGDEADMADDFGGGAAGGAGDDELGPDGGAVTLTDLEGAFASVWGGWYSVCR